MPRIYRHLEYCGVPYENIQLVNLNLYDFVYKQNPSHEEKGLNINYVPDLLVYGKNVEIGSIVERPIISWEKAARHCTTREIRAAVRDGYLPAFVFFSRHLQPKLKIIL